MLRANTVIFFVVTFLVLLFLINIPTDSKEFSLEKSQDFYKEYYMSKDGRIMDPQRGHISTSEGQSYMLLRSLLSNDKKTFDLVYKWTVENLRRPDYLFAWLWGKNKDGDYKIIDQNSASDADVDIAFALISAYEKWGDRRYLQDALLVIDSIWAKEIKQINCYTVLMPGVAQTLSGKNEINPSYFSPYAFKVFKKYDRTHPWHNLADSSYQILSLAMAENKSGLPPDWCTLEDNHISFAPERSDFSYDAIRVFARTYLDYKLTGDTRAKHLLENSNFFVNQWKVSHNFYTNYKLTGELKNRDKFVGSIAILVPVINLEDKKTAKEIYLKELYPIFSTRDYWESKNDYYGQNLLWFGCYFYQRMK